MEMPKSMRNIVKYADNVMNVMRENAHMNNFILNQQIHVITSFFMKIINYNKEKYDQIRLDF